MKFSSSVTTVPAIFLLSLLLVLAALAMPAVINAQTPTPTPPPTTTVEFDPTPLNLAPGASGTVEVMVNNVTDTDGVSGFNIVVNFDESVVAVDSIGGGEAPFGGAPTCNTNVSGQVSCAGFQSGIPGPTGDINIFDLNLIAVGATGTTTALTLTTNSVADSNGDDIPATPVNGQVNIVCPECPIAQDDDVTTNEDTPLNGDVFADNGNGVDSDPQGDSIFVDTVNGDSGNVDTGPFTLSSGALLTVNSDGSFTYDPNGQFESLDQGQQETDSFEYTISDGANSSNAATVTITITGVNEVPIAVDDISASFTTDEDTLFTTGNVLDNDSDPDNDPNSLSVESFETSGTLGSVDNNGDGTFDYDPNGQFEFLGSGDSATDTFTYTVTDGLDTATATVTITINGVNDEPVANADSSASFTTDEDTAFTTGNVLDNDTDEDTSDTLSVDSFDDSSTLGVVTDNEDGTFDYDPDGGFDGLAAGETDTDTFTYDVTDGLATDTATVTITINGVNDPPNIDPQPFSVPENSPDGTSVGIVEASDPDNGDTLSFTITGGTGSTAFAFGSSDNGTDAPGGSVGSAEIIVADSTQLDAATNPILTLEVEVTDSGGLTDSATMTIDVTSFGIVIVETGVEPHEPGTGVSEDGATDTYDVTLNQAPTSDVTVEVDPIDGQVTVTAPDSQSIPGALETQINDNAIVLTFTPEDFDVPQTVTVAAVDDTDVEGSPHTGTISHTASSTDSNFDGLTKSLTVNIVDNDGEAPDTVYVDDDFAGITLGTDPDGEGDATVFGFDAFATIQEGIDAVGNSTVNVAAGTYIEDLIIPQGQDNLDLVGAGADTTTIKGVQQVDSEDFPLALANIEVLGSGAQIHEFTIEGPDPAPGFYSSGIVVGGDDLELFNNTIKVPTAPNWDDISQGLQTYRDGNNPTGGDVDGLNIHDNNFEGLGTGIAGYEAIFINHTSSDPAPDGTVAIRNNTFSGSILRAITTERSNTTISGNTITTDLNAAASPAGPGDAFQGILVQDFSNRAQDSVVIDGNTVTGSDTGRGFAQGVRIGSPAQSLTGISVINNNLSLNNIGVQVRSSFSEVTVNFNNISGNLTFGVEALGGTVSGYDMLDATNNWWGMPSGASGLPSVSSEFSLATVTVVSAAGDGDAVEGLVDYRPWLLEADGEAYDQTFVLTEPGEFAIASAPQLLSEVPTLEQDDDLDDTTDETSDMFIYLNGEFIGVGQEGFEDAMVNPLSAFHAIASTKAGVGFRYDGSIGPTSRELSIEWNLIGTHTRRDVINALTTIQTTADRSGMVSLWVPDAENDGKDLGHESWGGTDVDGDGDQLLNANPLHQLSIHDDRFITTMDGYWVQLDAPRDYFVAAPTR